MTDRYAVIGNPIAHSLSPRLHAEFARQCGQDIRYEAILAPADGFADAVQAFRRAGGKGVNVTVPFKVAALELADRHSERARMARAVNTLKFDDDGIFGDNTDGVGLVTDIRDRLGVDIDGRRVLVLGAGGAARGVVLPLLEAGASSLIIANRTPERAVELIAPYGVRAGLHAGGFGMLGKHEFDIVINATSASLSDQGLPLPSGVFAAGSLAYDMVYGKGTTRFLADASAQGAALCCDGLGMLVAQAAESFRLWRGVMPDIAPVMAMMQHA
ncbi:MAG: shikimate dehydrogenase [Rhodocyclaceae bacterium]|nr:shikimate dehydrogenase [Rhodocyclaceae bacterium]